MIFLLILQWTQLANSSSCSDAVTKVLTNTYLSLFTNQSHPSDSDLLRLSGKFINELGHYDACLRRKDTSYYILESKRGLKLSLGVCVPKECTINEVNEALSQESSGKISASPVYEESVTGFGWFIITLLILFTLTGILGSVYDFSKRKSLLFAAIHSFSFKRNYASLMLIRQSQPGDHSNIIESIRVFCICLVICAHSFTFKTQNPIYNIEEIENIFQRNWRNIPLTGEFAVDMFFWIGGFLLGYLLLQEVEKKRGKFGVLGWTLVYLHRFARILPVYAFLLAFYMNIFPALGSGPAWYTSKVITLDCSRYWWSVVLFINNFVPDGYGNQCLGVGWYLANDMQFFALGPVLILVYYYSARWFSWLLKCILIIVGFIVSFIIAYDNDYSVFRPSPKNAYNGQSDYYHMFYTKPYIRFIPYLVGLYSGYVYLRYSKKYISKTEDTHKDWISENIISACKHKLYGTLIFIVSIIVCFWMFLLANPVSDHYFDLDYWGKTKNAFWIPTRRILFSYGFTFFLIPIMIGRFNWLYKILSADIFIPLGKLSFTCFLVQFGILFLIFGSQKDAALICGTTLLKDTVVGIVLSFVVSFIIYLLIEAPFANLEKIVCSMLAKPKE